MKDPIQSAAGKSARWLRAARDCGTAAPAIAYLSCWLVLLLLAPALGQEVQSPPRGTEATADAVTDLVSNGESDTDDQHLARLRQDVDAIRALLAAQLPPEFESQRLFDVDLLDEDAITARIAVLQSRVAANEARRRAILGIAAAPAEGTPSAETATPPPLLDQGATEQGAAAAPVSTPSREITPGDRQTLTLLALEIERDRLRLAFLERPPAERATVIEAERKRRRITAEEEAAQTARVQAQKTERHAQAARDAALQEVQWAGSAAAKELANERARAEAARAAIATLKGQLAEQRKRDAEAAKRHVDQHHAFAQKVADPDLDAGTADALYDSIVAALRNARAELAGALDELGAPTRSVAFKPSLDTSAPELAQAAQARAALQAVIQQVRDDATMVTREEAVIREARAAEQAAYVVSLNELRLQLLPRLSAAKRGAVLGFTGEGLAQLRREVAQLHLMARWYPYELSALLRSLPQRLQRLSAFDVLNSTSCTLILFVAATLVVRARYGSWLRALSGLVLAQRGNQTLSMVVDRWLRAFAAVAPAFGVLVFVLVLFWIVDQSTLPAGLATVEPLALAYAWYRFGVAAVHHFLISALVTARVAVSPKRTKRIRDSVRLVGRYAFAVAVVLIISSYILGRGYLFHLVLDLAWVGGLPIAFLLTRHWQRDIAGAYLRQHAEGRLAGVLTSRADGALGVCAAAVAFFPVAVRGIGTYLRATALRFEQTRRALAFLFRRQLERHADAIGTGAADDSALPESLRRYFDDAVADDQITLDHYPYLDRVVRLIADWRAGSPAAAIALVGERGIGKTTWLRRCQAQLEGADIACLTLDQRITSPERMAELAAGLFGVRAAASAEAVADAAAYLSPRLLILDNCQYLYLRTVGGGRGYETLMDIIGRTCGRHFWLCAFSRYMWDHVAAVYQGQNFFRAALMLDAWDETSVGELIGRRMWAAGCVASYQDLIVRHVDGTTFSNEVIRTSESYRRLLWDYADGNPRVALHFWLRSLVPDGPQRVRVRLFEAPSADDLEVLQERARFLLGAVVLHQSLTVGEAARVLRYSPALCESLLEFLLGQGYLVNESGRFYISTQWYRAIIRFLKRKHLVLS